MQASRIINTSIKNNNKSMSSSYSRSSTKPITFISDVENTEQLRPTIHQHCQGTKKEDSSNIKRHVREVIPAAVAPSYVSSVITNPHRRGRYGVSIRQTNEQTQRAGFERSHSQRDCKMRRASSNPRLQSEVSAPKHQPSNSSDDVDKVAGSLFENKTPRLPHSDYKSNNRSKDHNSSINNPLQQPIQPNSAVQPPQVECSFAPVMRNLSAGSEGTPSGGTSLRRTAEASFSRTRESPANAVPARSSSLDRPQLGEAAKRFQSFVKADRERPVCVCSAAPYYERERVNMERKKEQLIAEAEAIRADIVLHRQQRQQLNQLYLSAQAAEECVRVKEDSLRERESALQEDEVKVEEREVRIRQERNDIEELRSALSLKEKDLEIKTKRYERESSELQEQVEVQKREKIRLATLQSELEKKKTELADEERHLKETKERLENQQREVLTEKRQIEKQKSALADAEMGADEKDAKLKRKEEDLKLKENSLEEQLVELKNLKRVNDKCDQAIRNKSTQLDNDLKQLQKQKTELNVDQERFNKEKDLWKLHIEIEKGKREEEYEKKDAEIQEMSKEIEQQVHQLREKKAILAEFEAELDLRANQLKNAEAQLVEKRVQESKREKGNADVEAELKRKNEGAEIERRQLLKRKEEVEKMEVECQAVRDELNREKEILKKKMNEIGIREDTVERTMKQIDDKQKNIELRESVLQSQEKRSEWYQSVMQDVVEEKQKLELNMTDFELEKRAFTEMRAVIEADQEKMTKLIRAREEALARLDLNVQQRAREVERQELLLDQRIVEESSNLKHKLLTVARPSDNPVVRQTNRLYQSSSSIGSTRQRMPLLPLNEVNRPASYRFQVSQMSPSSDRAIQSAAASTRKFFPKTTDLNMAFSSDITDGMSTQYGCLSSQGSTKGLSEIHSKKKKKIGRKHSTSKSSRKSPKPLHTISNIQSNSPSNDSCENIPPSDIEIDEEKKNSVDCRELAPFAPHPRLSHKRTSPGDSHRVRSNADLEQHLIITREEGDGHASLMEDIDDALATPREFRSSCAHIHTMLKGAETLPSLLAIKDVVEHQRRRGVAEEKSSALSCNDCMAYDSKHRPWSERKVKPVEEETFMSLELQEPTPTKNEMERQSIGLLGRINTDESYVNAEGEEERRGALQERQISEVESVSNERGGRRKAADHVKDYFHLSRNRFSVLINDSNNESGGLLLNGSLIDGLDSPLLL